MLIVKIPTRNGGMVTRVKLMLSSMNLEEGLTYPICSYGLTGMLSLWSIKEETDLLLLFNFGFVATLVHEIGTLSVIQQPWRLWREDSPLRR